MKNVCKTYNLLERISTLLRSEIRHKGVQQGLHPVHIEVLCYLSRCNKFSNTPASVSEYLGVTKGTISQSISLLESKELLVKVADKVDRRVIHLNLTEKGKNLIEDTMPPTSFTNSLNKLSDDEENTLQWQLESLLKDIQNSRNKSSFSICKTCTYNEPKTPILFYCKLLKEELPRQCGELICKEHKE